MSRVARGTMVVMVLIILSATSFAQQPSSSPTDFHLDAQPLVDALPAWAEQAGLQLIWPTGAPATTRMVAPRISGRLAPEDALRLLLQGSGLAYKFLGNQTVVIRESSTPSAARIGRLQDAAVRLAAAEEIPFGRSASSLPARIVSGENPSQAQTTELQEIVVTGSRLRAKKDSGPIVVFDDERISQLGATNVADVLNYLPQQSFASSEQYNFAGSRTIQLRGLGLGTTLVLINGQRTVTSALQGLGNVFDLNTVPLAAVDRIEVLSDSASAVYGADAVGGVVNILLKKAVDRPTLALYYGGARSGADERRISLSLGHVGKRLHGSVILDYFQRDFLPGSARSVYADQDFRRFGSVDARSTLSNPGNVYSLTGDNLPGLNSSFAAVPASSSGIGLTPGDFAEGAGVSNLESINRFSSVIPEAERGSITATADLDLSENLIGFGEFLYSHRDEARQNLPSYIQQGLVPTTNPFNPFGEDVVVDYLFSDLGPERDVSRSESFRTVVGLKGSHKNWGWQLSLLNIKDDGINFIENHIDGVRAAASLAATDPNVALNVFKDGAGGSPELLASLISPRTNDRFSSNANQASAFTRGTLLTLPSGPVEIVLGAEAREEEVRFAFESAALAFSADRRSTAAYSEARIPLVGESEDRARTSSLVLSLAGRYDHYDDFGGTFNPQYSLTWSPISSIQFRASFGNSFRPPSLAELNRPPTSFPSFVADPRRNNEFVPITFVVGGNSALEPEKSRTSTVGLAFTPYGDAGLHASATYWNIVQDQRVQVVPFGLILTNEAAFPTRFIRAEPTPADAAANLPGRLLAIDVSNINFGRLKTDGLDLQLTLPFETAVGRFVPSLIATWVDKFDAVDLVGVPPVERVGVAASQGTITRWRATFSLPWTWRMMGVATNVRFASSYDDSNTSNERNGRTVNSQTLVDVQGWLDLGASLPQAGWLKSTVIRLGVTNVFDRDPAFSEVGGNLGYDPMQSDLRQRFGYISVSKEF